VEFEETFTLVGIIESINMFLDFYFYRKFKFYHMDVKSTFLNGELEQKVYVEQPKGFLLTEKKDCVC
jgi:hypothetical protein